MLVLVPFVTQNVEGQVSQNATIPFTYSNNGTTIDQPAFINATGTWLISDYMENEYRPYVAPYVPPTSTSTHTASVYTPPTSNYVAPDNSIPGQYVFPSYPDEYYLYDGFINQLAKRTTIANNYDLVENYITGEATWTSTIDKIQDGYTTRSDGTGVPTWKNYVLTEVGSKIVFNSNSMGGLVYDAPSCSYSIQENGFNGNTVVPSVSAVATGLVNGEWVNLDVNNESCVVDVTSDAEGIVITSTKTNASTTFVQVLEVDSGSGIKETWKVTNDDNTPLGISQTVHTGAQIEIAGQVIDIEALNGQSFDRQYIIDNEAEILAITDSVSYDFDEGIDSLTGINIIYDNDYKVNLDYASGDFVGYLEIDPTITSTTNNDGMMITADQGNSSCADFTAIAGTPTGTQPRLQTPTNSGNQACQSAYWSFDLSSISGATVTSAVIGYDVSTVNGSPSNCEWVGLTTTPPDGFTTYGDTMSGTVFATDDSSCSSTGTGKTVTLNSAGETSATSSAGSYFNIGTTFVDAGQVRDGTEHQVRFTDNTATLTLTYSIPAIMADPPTNVVATDGLPIGLSWTAPTNFGFDTDGNANTGVDGYAVAKSIDGTSLVPLPDLSGTTGALDFSDNEFLLHGFETPQYKVHTFTTVGTDTFQVTAGSGDVEYLVVAGGGGGAGRIGGGGGAGGLLTATGYGVTAQSYSITVGSGGGGGDGSSPSGTATSGATGGNSVFDTITSSGGGGGGAYQTAQATNGNSGGSGGGGGGNAGGSAGGTGTSGQGNDGGTGLSGASSAGGGGGASSAGSGGTSTSAGGAGGDGLSSSITGTAVYYAGGGGGSADSNQSSGGLGGGGAGGGTNVNSGIGVAGTDGLGGGGGGTRADNVSGASGGSGIVIIKYLDDGSITATGGTVTTVSGTPTLSDKSANSVAVTNALTPTHEDDFSTDKGWVSLDSAKNAANLSTGTLDFEITRDGTSDDIDFDLGKTVSDTEWVLRFKMAVDTVSNTSQYVNIGSVGLSSASGTGNFDFIGLSMSKGNGATYQHYTATGHENGSGIEYNPPNQFSHGLQVETVYVEIIRTSATSYTVELFSDSNYSTSIEKETGSISSGVGDLQYFHIRNFNNGANVGGSISGAIDDVYLYDGVSAIVDSTASTTGTIGTAIQNPNLTYSDSNLPDNSDALSVGGFVKLDETTPTLQDDFSGTDNWTAINSGVGVNVASDLIDWESDGVVPHASTYIAQSISDSSFILDFDITFDTVTSGSDTDGLYIAVLLDAENTYLSDGYFLRDALGVAFELDNSPSSTTNIQAFACDNLNIYDCFELNTPTGAVSTFAETGVAGETMNVRMVRDAGSFEVCVYPTASRTTATECETVDANDGGTVNGLQNIHVATTFDNTNDHTFDGTVDNIVLYNGITSIPAPTGKLLGLNDVTFSVGATTASVDETVTTTLSYSTSLIYQESTGWQGAIPVYDDGNTSRTKEGVVVGSSMAGNQVYEIGMELTNQGTGGTGNYQYTVRDSSYNLLAYTDWQPASALGSQQQVLSKHTLNVPVTLSTGDMILLEVDSGVTSYNSAVFLSYTNTGAGYPSGWSGIAYEGNPKSYVTRTAYKVYMTFDSNAGSASSSSSVTTNIISATGLTDNTVTPQHYAFTRDGNDWRLYQNGSPVTFSTVTFEDDFDGTDSWTDTDTAIGVTSNEMKYVASGAEDYIHSRYDLGSTVSDTAWVLRLTAQTAQPTSNPQLFVGLSSNTSELNTSQDFLGYSSVYNDNHWGIVYGDGSAVPNSSNSVSSGSDKYYVEIKRESATQATLNIWTGSYGGTLVASHTRTDIPSTIVDLQYIKFGAKDMYSQTVVYDDLEFHNGVTTVIPPSTFITDSTSLGANSVTGTTPLVDDDFSSYTTQSSADAVWVPNSANSDVNISNDNLEFTSSGSGNYIDLNGAVLDNDWSLQFKLSMTAKLNGIIFMVQDSTATNSATARDGIGLRQTDSTSYYDFEGTDNTAGTGGQYDYRFTVASPALDTKWIKIIRTSATEASIEFYSDEYSTLIDSQTVTIANIDNLRYFVVSTSVGSAFTIDDVKFYDVASPVTPSASDYTTNISGSLDEFFINSDTLTATEIAGMSARGVDDWSIIANPNDHALAQTELPNNSRDETSVFSSTQIFTSDGSLVLTETQSVDYLIVAGGGGGGRNAGGGGGAGGMLTGTVTLSAGTYAITVGDGGVGQTSSFSNPGDSGNDSTFYGLTAIGGGGGASDGNPGINGGSGGGSGRDAGAGGGAGGTGVTGQGNAGAAQNGYNTGQGGGGSGSVGAQGTGSTDGGNGGDGTTSNISGTNVIYAVGGGGGGGFSSTTTGGTGSADGGGKGAYATSGSATQATAGTANTGNGGGGGNWDSYGNHNGASGGSGIVIVSYTIPAGTTGEELDFTDNEFLLHGFESSIPSPAFETDFTSDADWTTSSTSSIEVTNDELQYKNNYGGNYIYYDLGSVSDDKWLLQYKITFGGAPDGTDEPAFGFGLYDYIGDMNDSGDRLGMWGYFDRGNTWHRMYCTVVDASTSVQGLGCVDGSGSQIYQTISIGTDYWVSMNRDGSTFTSSIYTSDDYTGTPLVTLDNQSVPSTIDGLQYLTASHYVQGGGITAVIDDVTFYNGVTSASPVTTLSDKSANSVAITAGTPVTWDSASAVGFDISGATVTPTHTSIGHNNWIRTLDIFSTSSNPSFSYTLGGTSSPNTNQIVGITNEASAPSSGTTYGEIDFGIYTDGSGLLIIENGGTPNNWASYGSWSITDTFSIDVSSSGTVEYKSNGVTFHTSTNTASGDYYFVATNYRFGDITHTIAPTPVTSTTGTIGTALQNPYLTYADSNLPDNTDTLSVGGFVKLDEGAKVTSNDGTNNGATTGVTGKVGNAWEFDGSNDYVQSGFTDNLGTQFSVSMWMQFDSISSWDAFMGKGASDSNEEFIFYIGSGAQHIRGEALDDMSFEPTSGNTVSPSSNTWYHITYTVDGDAGLYYVYIGDESGTPTQYQSDDTITFTNTAGTEPINIGGNTRQTSWHDGKFDEVLVYDKVLTQSEVNALHNSGSGTATPDTSGLLLHYDFEQTGNTLENQVTSAPVPQKLLGLNDISFNVGTTTASVTGAPVFVTTSTVTQSSTNEWTAVSSGTGVSSCSGQVFTTNSAITGETMTSFTFDMAHQGGKTGSLVMGVFDESNCDIRSTFRTIDVSTINSGYSGSSTAYTATGAHVISDGDLVGVKWLSGGSSGNIYYKSQNTDVYDTGAGVSYNQEKGYKMDGQTNSANRDATFTITLGEEAVNTLFSATGLTDNTVTPQHYTFTRDASNLWTIYQNGVSQTTATDSTSLGSNGARDSTHDGTNNGATTGATGKVGSAWDFTTSDSVYVEIPSPSPNTNTDTTKWSMNTWVKLGTTTHEAFLSVGTSSFDRIDFRYHQGNDDFGYIEYGDASNYNGWDMVGGKYDVTTTGDWHMITMVRDGLDMYHYYNGVHYYTDTYGFDHINLHSAGLPSDSLADGNWRIGQGGYTPESWTSEIDEMSFWSEALTPTDVTALYASTSGIAFTDSTFPKKSNIIAHYDFEQTGNTLENQGTSPAPYTTNISGTLDEFFVNSDTLTSAEVEDVSKRGTTVSPYTTTSTTFNDNEVVAGNEYFYKVYSVTDAVYGVASNVDGAQTVQAANAPTNVVATNGITQANVSWTASTDLGNGSLLAYKIYTNVDGGAWTFIQPSSLATTHTETNTVLGSTYGFKIVTVNEAGDSPPSVPAYVVIGTVPDAPTLTALTPLAGATHQIDWTAPTANGGFAVTGYEIERSTTSGSGFTTIAQVGNVLTFTDPSTTLTLGDTYYYRVLAINSQGLSAASNEGSGLTGDVPDAVANVTADAMVNYEINLNWTPANENFYALTTYEIFASENGGTPVSQGTVQQAQNMFLDQGLNSGSTYTYSVYATNSLGTSTVSNTPSTIAGDIPGVPSGLTVTPVVPSQLDAAWSASAANGYTPTYTVAISTDSGSTWDETSNTGLTALTLSKNGLVNGQTYQYKISATNTLGTSAYTAGVSGIAGDVPSQPVGLSVTTLSATELTFAWGVPNDNGYALTGYKVERSDDNFATTTVLNANFQNNVYTDTGLTASTTYDYRVSAINNLGTSPVSGTASGATFGVPDAVSDLALTTVSSTQIDLAWTQPALNGYTFVEYQIERSYDGLVWQPHATTTNTSYQDTLNTNANERYYYKIITQNSYGFSVDGNVENTYTLPTAPAAITATVQSDVQIDLVWNNPAGTSHTGFYIEQSIDAGTTWTPVTTTATQATSHNALGLTPLTDYQFRVSTINPAGTSVSSPVVSTTTFGHPGVPTTLTTTSLPGSIIELNWVAPTVLNGAVVTEYKIERSTDAGTTWGPLVTNTGSLAVTYQDTGLTTTQEYYYRVSAYNVYGVGNPGNESSSVASDVPSQVTGLTATPTINYTVDLAWSAPNGNGYAVSGYHIESSTDGGTTWTDLEADTASTATTYAHINLSAGVTYTYQVSAINTVGSGIASTTVSSVAGDVPDAPVLTLTALPSNTIQLDWTTPTNNGFAITTYQIERSADAGTTWAPVTSVNANTFQDPNLTNSVTYQYKVSATNLVGSSAFSGVVQIVAGNSPGTVNPLTATTTSNTSIDLAWTTPNPNGYAVTGYFIERSTDAGATWVPHVANTQSLSIGYSDTGLTTGTIYTYQVSAINPLGTGPASATASSHAGDVPGVPSLTLTALPNSIIQLDWTAPADNGFAITTYQVEKSIDAGATWSPLTSVNALTTQDSGLTNGNTYQYRVLATNQIGSSAFSGVVQIIAGDVPSAITALTATTQSDTSVSLTWPAAGDNGYAVTGYRVEQSLDSVLWTDSIANTQSTSLTYTVSGLNDSTDYYFKVTGINALGQGALGPVSPAHTFGAPDPFITLTTSSTTTSATVNWTAPYDHGSALTSYRVEILNLVNGQGNGQWLTLTTATPATLTNTHLNLQINTEYQYRVVAINAYGSSTSAVQAITTFALPPTLTATATSGTTLDLSWNTITGSPTYNIYSSSNNSNFVLEQAGITATTYQDTGLALGQTVYYKVSVTNAAGESAQSTSVSATTYSIADPPTNLTITNPTPTTARFTWTAPVDNGGATTVTYNIQRSVDNSNWDATYLTTSVTGIDDTSLTNGVQYYWKVNTVTSAGISADSNTVSYITPNLPTAPGSLTAALTGTSNSASVINWVAPSNTDGYSITGYHIERNAGGNGWTTLVADTGNSGSVYTNTGLTAGINYVYRVSAITAVGEGVPSNTASVQPVLAVLTITGTPTGGNSVLVTPSITVTGSSSSTIVQQALYKDNARVDYQAVSIALTSGASLSTMSDYPTQTSSFFMTITLDTGYVIQSNSVNLTPSAPFTTGDISFSEDRTEHNSFAECNAVGGTWAAPSNPLSNSVAVCDLSYTESVLEFTVQPAGAEVIISYQPQNLNEPAIIKSFTATSTQISETTTVDAETDYYGSIIVNPTFEYTTDGAGNITVVCDATDIMCETDAIPKGTPSEKTFKSFKSPDSTRQLGIEPMGDLFGVNMVFIFVIAMAGIFTGRSAPMGVIFIVVTLGVMAYLGYLDFGSTALNAATWALLIISAVLGIFLGKRYS